MAKRKRTVQAFILLGLRTVFFTPSGEVRAAQYNTSAASSWIQLEAADSFAGRNGEDSALVLLLELAPSDPPLSSHLVTG